MSVQVSLPPGCRGFNMQDGTSYYDRGSGRVTVADEHAPFVRRQVGGDAGLTGHGGFRSFLGTRDGRWCPSCRRIWNRWNAVCVKCGGDTVPEGEMPERPPAGLPSACPPVAVT